MRGRWATEGQAAGVYAAARPLTGTGIKDGLRFEIVFDKELLEVRRVTECDWGRMREQMAGGAVEQENVVAFPDDKFQNVGTHGVMWWELLWLLAGWVEEYGEFGVGENAYGSPERQKQRWG